jgi:hypothetical protein
VSPFIRKKFRQSESGQLRIARAETDESEGSNHTRVILGRTTDDKANEPVTKVSLILHPLWALALKTLQNFLRRMRVGKKDTITTHSRILPPIMNHRLPKRSLFAPQTMKPIATVMVYLSKDQRSHFHEVKNTYVEIYHADLVTSPKSVATIAPQALTDGTIQNDMPYDHAKIQTTIQVFHVTT